MKVNWHKISFEMAEQLYVEWSRFCHGIGHPDRIDIGTTIEDAFILAGCAGGLMRGGGGEVNRELAETHHWMLRWRKFGYPTFQLTHSLAAALMLTDCSSVSGADFRFPFPSFLITMPYPNSPLSIDGMGGSKDVKWIMVHTMDYPTQDSAPMMERRMVDKAWFTNEPSGVKWINSTMVRMIEPEGIGLFERKPFPHDDDTLESWLMTGLPLDAVHHIPSTSLDEAAALAGLRLVANLCLYLDAQREEGHDLPERHIHNPKKKKRRDKPGRAMGPAMPPAWILGQDIKLNAELRGAAAQMARPKSQQRAEWTLQSQHVVRGHWKQQMYGPGRTLRKRIRVEPYWRGPRLAEAVLRSFTEKS